MADLGKNIFVVHDGGSEGTVETEQSGNVINLSADPFQDRINYTKANIEEWLECDQKVQDILNLVTEMGIDLVPLHIRYVKGMKQLEKADILKHIREYLGTILRAYELIVEQDVGAISVHEQRSLSDAAIRFVKAGGSMVNRATLETIIDTVEKEEIEIIKKRRKKLQL